MQTVPQALPVEQEQCHKLLFENPFVRVFYVEVPAHSCTALHEHARDYFYVMLGEAALRNEVVGAPPLEMRPAAGEVAEIRGGFCHVMRNMGDSVFRNITVEVLQPFTLRRGERDANKQALVVLPQEHNVYWAEAGESGPLPQDAVVAEF